MAVKITFFDLRNETIQGVSLCTPGLQKFIAGNP